MKAFSKIYDNISEKYRPHFSEKHVISVQKTIHLIAINWAECNQLIVIAETKQSINCNEKLQLIAMTIKF